MRGMEKLKEWIAFIPIKSQAEFVTLPGFFKYSLGGNGSFSAGTDE